MVESAFPKLGKGQLEKRVEKLELDMTATLLGSLMHWSPRWAHKRAKQYLDADPKVIPRSERDRLMIRRLQWRVSALFAIVEEVIPQQDQLARSLAKVEALASMDAALLDWAFGDAEEQSEDDLEEPEE